jgi:outer membrane protein assembly factor BamB
MRKRTSSGGPLPVLGRERVDREVLDPEVERALDGVEQRGLACLVPACRFSPRALAQRPLPSMMIATWRGTRSRSTSLNTLLGLVGGGASVVPAPAALRRATVVGAEESGRVRRIMVRCHECGAEWDAATAGFCGRCGALLDSPAAPDARRGTQRGDADPVRPSRGEARDGDGEPRDRGSRVTVVVGLIVLVGIVVAAAVLSPPPQDIAADKVDLPPAPAGGPAPPSAVPGRPAAPASSPRCLIDDVEVHCTTWTFDVTAGDWPQVTLDGDHVVITTSVRMTALDLATGAARWTWDIDPRRRFDWFVAGGGVATLVEDGRLVALDLATGRPRWEAEDAVPYFTSAAGGDALVLTGVASTVDHASGGMGPHVVARSAADGTERWRFSLEGAQVDWVGRLGADAFVVTANDATLTVLDAAGGAVRWRQTSPGEFVGVTPDHLLFLPLRQDEVRPSLTALRRADGAVAWTAELPEYANHPQVMVVDDHVVVVGPRGEVHALHVNDGTLAWTMDLGGDGGPSLAWVEPEAGQWWPASASSDVVVVLNTHVALAGLDRRTGQLLWRRDDLRPEWATINGTRLHLWTGSRLETLDVATGRSLGTVEVPDQAWPVDFDPLILVSAGRVHRIDLPE